MFEFCQKFFYIEKKNRIEMKMKFFSILQIQLILEFQLTLTFCEMEQVFKGKSIFYNIL